ncbi:MAG: xanthine phosphoribosyltransferase [Oscillospiraceae bacterium]|jgi:xanthine phosphoribosyltransferase|nr:xanthine phosphoribosyltransferase [Oscillospiraceae bacterium]
MKLLEDRIRRDGRIRENGTILKVDSFLNHQMDMELYNEIGREFHRLFGGEGVTKLLTVEASGIGVACITGQYFKVPVLFAKKSRSKNIDAAVYHAPVRSYTYGEVYDIMVSKDFLHPEDRILIIDDFLANGAALDGLTSLVEQAGATLVGAGICVEKAFQPGGERHRQKGLRIESLARIKSMSGEGIEFC